MPWSSLLERYAIVINQITIYVHLDHIWWSSDWCVGSTLPQNNPQRILCSTDTRARLHVFFIRCKHDNGALTIMCNIITYTQVFTMPQKLMTSNLTDNMWNSYHTVMTLRYLACMIMPTLHFRWLAYFVLCYNYITVCVLCVHVYLHGL